MSSFDEFWDKFAIGLNADENEAQSIWEAVVQSRQAEIDELKKRIDDAIYDLQHIESAMWEEQIDHVLFVLKGDQS